MSGPARLSLALLALSAVAAAAGPAAATDRFVPTDPNFVVANVSRSLPDESLRRRMAQWQADPTGAPATALAEEFLDRARARREPMFVGRAESVLAGAVRSAHATNTQKRLYAQTLQFRHEFPAAETLLDGILAQDPRDSAARTLRASVRLVRGNFTGARGDCALLVAGGDAAAPIGVACLAEALAGTGQIERGLALLRTYPLERTADARARAYLLTVRAELAERSANPQAALADYAQALRLAPSDDSIRAALADALAARGATADARALLEVERPSLALLARQAALASERERERGRLRARAQSALALEAARGDATHHREAALLALATGHAALALDAARKNFALQREMADVRVLAGAAAAAQSTEAAGVLREWMKDTGFADAVTESVLAGIARR